MRVPKKITERPISPMFPLSTFLKHLDFSQYRDKLPGDASKDEHRYYQPESFLKAIILRQLLNIPYRNLESFLVNYKEYRLACGFSQDYVPNYTYFCKFFTALQPTMIEEIAVAVLQKLSHVLCIPCQVVAIDSTGFKTQANSFKKEGDPDAKTGKSSTKGWFFGYKVHIAVDITTELPVAMIITPANCYDGHELRPLLDKTVQQMHCQIKAVLGDKGYDASYNYLDIVEVFNALPIISKRGDEVHLAPRQQTLDRFLSTLPPVVPQTTPDDHNERGKQYRQSPPLPRTDDRWNQLTSLRIAAERAIGRYKSFFCPERIRTTSLTRASVWCLVGWLAQLASALFLCQQGLPNFIRCFPYVL